METLLVFSLTLTLNGQQVGSASHWDTLDDCRHAARQLESRLTPPNYWHPNLGGHAVTCAPVVFDPRKDTFWR